VPNCEDRHEFMPPIVVKTEGKAVSVFCWGMFVDTESRTLEKMVTICSRCGTQISCGWIAKSEDE
jgi:hypothetical protein